MAKKPKKTATTGEEFLKLVEAVAPDKMSGMDVIKLITSLVLFYADDESEARVWIMAMARYVKDYYTMQNDGECTCDKCTAKRKAESH
jgi:hypothetical protein